MQILRFASAPTRRGAADWVIRQTRAQLTEKEMAQFLVSLSMYPKWKLLEIDQFRGYFSDVLRYLENLQAKPSDPYSELGYDKERKLLAEEPESQVSQKIQIARDFNDHVQKHCHIDLSWDRRKPTDEERRERLQGELNSYKGLNVKYPHLHILEKVKDEKRFAGL